MACGIQKNKKNNYNKTNRPNKPVLKNWKIKLRRCSRLNKTCRPQLQIIFLKRLQTCIQVDGNWWHDWHNFLRVMFYQVQFSLYECYFNIILFCILTLYWSFGNCQFPMSHPVFNTQAVIVSRWNVSIHCTKIQYMIEVSMKRFWRVVLQKFVHNSMSTKSRKNP